MRAINRLLQSADIERIAGIQNSKHTSLYDLHRSQQFLGALAFYYPKIYASYQTNLDLLFTHDPGLRRNFSNSIYPAMTINAGPSTVSLGHTDSGNVPGGICTLTALGDYDYRLGGHLILFDLGLIIEFPPGSTILLPSATLRHGNTTIQRGESQYSIAQYCSGGLIRWVRYGFRTRGDILREEGGTERLSRIEGEGDERWQEALAMFSTVEDLAKDQAKVSDNRG